MTVKHIHLALLVSGAAALAWSAVDPYDWPTWAGEVAPAVIGGVIFAAVYPKFRFTTLSYVLAWFFSLILIVGGHYTYAHVPLGDWVKDTFDLSRNHYDRLGHFFQGFTPAIIARELLLRTSPLRPGKWLFVIVTFMCLAISAMYELVEWGSTAIFGGGSLDFLGTQGDVWDAQKDMLMALIGAIVAQLVLGRYHTKAIDRLEAMRGGKKA